jgi:hypothetical protein
MVAALVVLVPVLAPVVLEAVVALAVLVLELMESCSGLVGQR